ncbi:MAG: DNA polymerase III subunit gamma/tau [Bacteroidales bacterium]|jgi:DNA polymerase-3 subunit gamma/tau|nr:DNA polymerase III subunit gamma/tau [Bacteroidales bacterium]
MENFIVSARQYRPKTFETVIGQNAITNTLKNAIKNGHIGQSFLFCGPRGVGKTTCARIFAKTINCAVLAENIKKAKNGEIDFNSFSIESCKTDTEKDLEHACESCKSFKENSSFNIYELDAASNRNVESMRHLIEHVRIQPQTGIYSVYIIDEVHMLTTEAFNTFLKTLEEPPGYVKFILATTEKNKIIPTILSRCQIFDFRRIGISDIVKQLASVAAMENITAQEEALRIIAQKSDGGMRDALSMFDQIVSFSGNTLTYNQVIDLLNILDYEYYFKICDEFFGGTEAAALNLLNEIWENGFDPQEFLNGLSHHLRNLLIMQDVLTVPLLESSEELRNRYALQAKKSTVSSLMRALDLCAQCDLNYRASNNKRLLVEILLLQLCELLSGKAAALSASLSAATASTNAPTSATSPAQSTAPQPSVQVAPPATQPTQAQIPPQPTTQAAPTATTPAPATEPTQAQTPPQPTTQTAPPATAPASAEQPTQAQTLPQPTTQAAPTATIPASAEQPTQAQIPPQPTTQAAPTATAPASAEQPTQAQTSPQPQQKSTFVSLQSMTKEAEPQTNTATPAADQQFTQHDLSREWKTILAETKTESPLLHSILVNAKPVIKENTTIEIIAENDIQKKEITEKTRELRESIRQKLQNSSIEIVVSTAAVQIQKERQPYTAKEKFNALNKTNPYLQNFKDELGLEIEM